ncbi:MAG: membrane integrity-associated transporter subunit PqiC [Deltaproteobacteria bacterium]|nr:membrane integrity-associated transporter subunit PqiC [Candidatus Anaeroferrophillus wilburensis]MBN2889699.1 membrane integrity-associated transporter subunit PqiC [Deltaproteobacteria bacterium]
MKYALLLAAALMALACGSCSLKPTKGSAPTTTYILQDLQPATPIFRKQPFTLLIRETAAPALISSRKIIYSKTPATRSFYQYASWADTPPNSLTRLLTARLEKNGPFAGVCRRPSAISTDLQLALELDEFYHDAGSNPGMVKIAIRGKLFDSRRKAIIAQQRFAKEVAVERYDSRGAVEGFSRAVSLILDDIVSWLTESAATLPAP